ncbi:hypothetical protein M413DRAFT_449390 [Hebeloma cylindrosporum]|uniref:Uncharacterized protein n=1 Tax=Hebeloma cylindrosporum TaxID=76867 RepID=A0A0C2Y4T6_HEBCY|nr:hypothetical protein M413DRAFT_449390 [Hebeloma cylindrosporum h7]
MAAFLQPYLTLRPFYPSSSSWSFRAGISGSGFKHLRVPGSPEGHISGRNLMQGIGYCNLHLLMWPDASR